MADPGTLALLTLGSGLLSGGGNLLGGLLGGGDSSISSSDIPASGINPSANPLIAAFTTALLGALGQSTAGTTQAASPLAQLQNLPGTGALGFNARDQGRLNSAISFASPVLELGLELGADAQTIEDAVLGVVRNADRNFQLLARTPEELERLAALGRSGQTSHDGDVRARLFQRALGASGLGTVAELATAQDQFITEQARVSEAAQEAQPNVIAGNLAAQETISSLQQNFPTVTPEAIAALEESFRQQSRERVLQAANVGGFNPASGLARIEEDPQPLISALALLEGQTNIANSAIQGLQRSTLDPILAAISGGQVSSSASNQAASIASDQARALAGINAQLQGANAGALGTGVAGAFGGLASGLNDLATLNLFQQIANQPGSGGRGATATP